MAESRMPDGCVPCPGAGGFTLIELSVVLFIITLLLAGALTPLTQQLAERQNSQTQRDMQAVAAALIGYGLSHRDADHRPYLPCPDLVRDEGSARANDGLEDRLADGTCQQAVGNLPWITLGVAENDAWGNRYTYAISASFSGANQGLSAWPAPLADVEICLTSPCDSRQPAAALVLSHGRNGLGAVNQSGRHNLAGTGDEAENSDGDLRFVQRPPSAIGTPGGEFDDLSLALSVPYLIGRLCGNGPGC